MTANQAKQFAFDSFVTAFAPGNEHLLDHFFAADLILINHSVSKHFNLTDLKTRLPNIHKKYQQIKSEIKDMIMTECIFLFYVIE